MGFVKKRIKQGLPVKSPTEDSLSPHQTNMLVSAGYTYNGHANKWHLPSSSSPNAETTLTKLKNRRLGR
jgi:hypothetical protein